MYSKRLANIKLLEIASKGEKYKKETVHYMLPIYFGNKGTFNASASIGLKINIYIRLCYFCVKGKGVFKCTMCMRLFAYVCGKLVDYDHVLLFGTPCPLF